MKNYMESVGGLRKAMIADIEECLREANRSIVVKSGHISYLCYNLAFSSTNEDELQCVPDVEIRMLAHDKDFGFRFVDAHNHGSATTCFSKTCARKSAGSRIIIIFVKRKGYEES